MVKRRIILTEDDPDDRELFTMFLAHRADIALLPIMGHGMELLTYLENLADAELPELIILDQNMPMMNGKQTLEALRDHARLATIPTVVYSTYADSKLVAECTKLGARMVAMKPLDKAGYNKMMNDFLSLLVNTKTAYTAQR